MWRSVTTAFRLTLGVVRRWILKKLPRGGHRYIEAAGVLLSLPSKARIVSEAVRVPYPNEVLVGKDGVLERALFRDSQDFKVFTQVAHARLL
jgi:hypothetical protein